MTQNLTERAVLVGARQSLAGILARPSVPAQGAPAIVILNTGIMHRVGPHRLSVMLSRRLARAGYAALRFDFSGIGDSDPRPDGLAPLESCLADIREAIDWLQTQCGASQVVLVGLCSGADHAVLYGYGDPRVVGLVLMDPSIPATSRYYVHYVAQRIRRLQNWASLLRGRSGIVRTGFEQLAAAVLPGWRQQALTLQNLRTHPELERIYERSVANGLQMLAVFTGDSTRQTYSQQMIDAFPGVAFGSRLQIELFESTDHLFNRQADRLRLMEVVVEWLSKARASF
jgi:pimeloyl-ACP methyl ester carboxylesterase